MGSKEGNPPTPTNTVERENHLELYKAALRNDWEKAKSIYQKPGVTYGAIITPKGETALHLAALQGHQEFVENLVQKMTETETEQTNGLGNTAFHCAALQGHVDIAKAIVRKANLDRLTVMRGEGYLLPINMASLRGKKEMVAYLYKATEDHLLDSNSQHINGDDRKALLNALINADMFGVAIEMVKALISVRIAPDQMEEEALKVLALKPLHRPFLYRFYRPSLYREINLNVDELTQLLWDKVASDETRVHAFIESPDPNPIFEAAKRGNSKFLFVLIGSYPDVQFSIDENRYTIFHHAILSRHFEIFQLFNIGSVAKFVTSIIDEEGNNILHLVAKLPPPNRLSILRGAVLQLHGELMCFEELKKMMEPHEIIRKNHSQSYLQLRKMLRLTEEMKKVVTGQSGSSLLFENLKMVMEHYSNVLEENTSSTTQLENMFFLFEEIKMVMEQYEWNQNKESTVKYTPRDSQLLSVISLFKEMKNVIEKLIEMKQNNESNKSYTPIELFEKEHKELMKEGEKWMKDTANSCMVIAALITTITVAAAITVPGGNADDGYPNWYRKAGIRPFVLFNWISFMLSATTLIIFLTTYTSKYSLDDFRKSLPIKLVIGLNALGLSTEIMMVTFSRASLGISKIPSAVSHLLTYIPVLPLGILYWNILSLSFPIFLFESTSHSRFKSGALSLLFKDKKQTRFAVSNRF